MVDKQNKLTFTDEFDILDIIKRILKFLLRARNYLVAAFFLAIIAAVTIYLVTPPQYESTMTAYSVNLQDAKAVALMEDLERYLQEGDYEQMSQKMGLSLEKVEKIVSIKSSIEINKYKTFQEDVKDGFSVKVRVRDKTILDSLAIGIKRFVERSEFVKDQITSFKLSLQYNIVKTEEELKDLDSLRSSLFKVIQKGGQARLTSNIVLSDISYISSKRIELNDRLSNLRQQLALASDLKVLKPFSQFKKKSWPRLGVLLVVSVTIFEILALILYSSKYILNFLKEV